MHFYAWKGGLKTGMYYLRTKPAADAIKFTLDVQSLFQKSGFDLPAAEKMKKNIKDESLKN